MQSVYSTLDWLGGRLASIGRDRSAWIDVVGPANVLESSAERMVARSSRQEAMADLVREVLTGGPARDHLRAHLRKALGLSDDDEGWHEIEALLWAPPRALLLAVLPTIERRLRSEWAGEVPDRTSHQVRTRTPLGEFVAGNLFDDLLTPEVEVQVPTGDRDEAYESVMLPTLRTINELMPGNVTRHFGVSSFSRRHWLFPGGAVVDVVDAYQAQFTCTIRSVQRGDLALYTPTAARLVIPPAEVRDATSVRPVWGVHAEPLGRGQEVRIGQDRWAALLPRIRVHTHALGDGARYRRYAVGAQGTIYEGREPKPVRSTFTAPGQSNTTVGLGVEYDADAICLEVAVPSPPPDASGLERADRLTCFLGDDPTIPIEFRWFERSAMVSALMVVIAELEPVSRRTALDALPDAEFSSRLADALLRLGQTASPSPDSPASNGASARGQTADESPTQNSLLSWCEDSNVLAAARRSAASIWLQRDADWIRWWRHRFATSVGAVFLEAIGRAAPEVDISDLTIDLEPAGAAPSQSTCEVWIAEVSPGGNGQVEEIHRVLAEDPRRFARLLDGVLLDNDFERMDDDVRAFLHLEAASSVVREACASVRGAWAHGHAAVADAFQELRVLVEMATTHMSRSAWTIIMNRVLGPGAHPDLASSLRNLLTRWDEVEAANSLEVPAAVIGALTADDDSFDNAFRMGDDPSRLRRSRTIGGYFWPRGGSAQRIRLDAGNVFGLLPDVDQSIVRDALDAPAAVIEIEEWTETTEALTHRALVDHGYVILRFGPGSRRSARDALLRLQFEPTDIGSLLVYPRVVGSAHRDGHLDVEVVLDEVP
jgi:hypothetical protein